MEQAVGVHAHWPYRDAVPAVDRLLARGRAEDELGGLEVTRSACDEWLSDGDLSIVVGEPRAGKSSLLRFVVSDLLDDGPRSASAARVVRLASAGAVGVLVSVRIPQGGCRAVGGVRSLGLAHPLLCAAPAPSGGAGLADDRLLLVVDGLDEWTDEGSARPAVTLLENFVRSRNVDRRVCPVDG
ncbi:hypothetical protein [Streptomyces rhizosphaericus]|uniref:Uncharacterized protein n=1 Tax=Streptomyces rhizosphaericus TaxID=114699 RepID=A0A6G4AUP6_9ACTN|nr:hypothetical protein [Streptomyces rhizosphaericus]NEW76484.1 hypothetical protein [Streptomyces rhizosphaericus]